MNTRERVEQKYADIMNFIAEFAEENGYSPTVDEIAKGCYRSAGTVNRGIEVLAARGKLDYVPFKPRTIRLTEEGKKWRLTQKSQA